MDLKFSKTFVPAVCALTAAVLLAGCNTSSEKKKTIVVQRPAHIEASVYIREASANAEPETLSGAAYNQKAVVHTLNREEPLVAESAVTVPIASSVNGYALQPVKSSLQLAQELAAHRTKVQQQAASEAAAKKAQKVKKPKVKKASGVKPAVKTKPVKCKEVAPCPKAVPETTTVEIKYRELTEKKAEDIIERARSLAPETKPETKAEPAPAQNADDGIKAEAVPVLVQEAAETAGVKDTVKEAVTEVLTDSLKEAEKKGD
jgi:hypothetical protein